VTKPVLSLIVAAAENNVIGADNKMLWHIPEDFKHFKNVTMGKPCIMGRKTFDSIVASLGKPLPGRINIVISRHNPQYAGALTVQSLDEALDQASKVEGVKEIMIIGGAQIYEQALPRADKIYLTRVHQSPEGDAYFPALTAEWRLESEQSGESHDFLVYRRISA
jgi:dihydrofolate reductase